MRSSAALALGILASSASAALNLARSENPSFVELPFTKEHVRNSALLKRASDLSVDVNKRGEGFLYWVNYTIGTPAKDLYAVVDTGSSDLLVLTDNVETCQENATECHGGIFEPKKSSTWKWSDIQAEGSFGSHEAFQGNYATDVLGIGGKKVKEFGFVGVTDYQESGNGIISIFGIGLNSGEHILDDGESQPYANLVYALAEADIIKSAAYSMYLDNYNQGSFLFGAVDKSKYKEPLLTFPIAIDNQVDARDRLTVVMTGFGVSKDNKADHFDFKARPVLLDSGTEKTALPLDLFEYILEQTGGGYDSELKGFTAPCWDRDVTVDFQFSELTIRIPAGELMIPLNVGAGVDEKQWCLMQYSAGLDSIILGDDFLRSAYIVYDYDKLEISLAAVNTNGGKSDIVEIDNKVPTASSASTVDSYEDQFQTPNPELTAKPESIPDVTITQFANEPQATNDNGPSGDNGDGGSSGGSGGSGGDGDEGDSAAVTRLPMASGALLVAFAAGVLFL